MAGLSRTLPLKAGRLAVGGGDGHVQGPVPVQTEPRDVEPGLLRLAALRVRPFPAWEYLFREHRRGDTARGPVGDEVAEAVVRIEGPAAELATKGVRAVG
eukprot:1462560-Alexandrium_andersonii.AAC.1